MDDATKRALAFIATVFVLGFICGSAWGAEVYPMIDYSHASDIRRGPPFNDEPEPTHEHLGAGATVVIGKRRKFHVDITHGYKRIKGTGQEDFGEWETSTRLGVRWYPRKAP